MNVRPAKTQISLGIRPVWSESSLCTQWAAKEPRFLHEDSEDSDQTERMSRLIWVLARRTLTLLVLSCRGSYLFACPFSANMAVQRDTNNVISAMYTNLNNLEWKSVRLSDVFQIFHPWCQLKRSESRCQVDLSAHRSGSRTVNCLSSKPGHTLNQSESF